MTIDIEANARQQVKEMTAKGHGAARVGFSVTVCEGKLEPEWRTYLWFDGAGGNFEILTYKVFPNLLAAYEAAEQAIAELPDKRSEARAEAIENARKALAALEKYGLSVEELK